MNAKKFAVVASLIFTLIPALGTAQQSQEQDNKTSYPKMAPLEQSNRQVVGWDAGSGYVRTNENKLTGISGGALIDLGNFADLDRFAEPGTGGRLVRRGRVKSMTRWCENDGSRLAGGDCRQPSPATSRRAAPEAP
jgi:hypothetical protein